MMSEWRTHLVRYSREWWKERLPLIQAFAEGHPIEYYQFGWVERTTSSFLGSIQNYRLAKKIFAVNPRYPEGYLEKWMSEATKNDLLFKTKEDALDYLANRRKLCELKYHEMDDKAKIKGVQIVSVGTNEGIGPLKDSRCTTDLSPMENKRMIKYSCDWWKERLSLIQAFVEGKDLEYQGVCWVKLGNPSFEEPVEKYRIAEKMFVVNIENPTGIIEKDVSELLDTDVSFSDRATAEDFFKDNIRYVVRLDQKDVKAMHVGNIVPFWTAMDLVFDNMEEALERLGVIVSRELTQRDLMEGVYDDNPTKERSVSQDILKSAELKDALFACKKKKDIKLVEECIEHWIEVYKDTSTPTGWAHCSLCAEYYHVNDYDRSCNDCPIFLKTGSKGCKRTPYSQFDYSHDRKDALYEILFLDDLYEELNREIAI